MGYHVERRRFGFYSRNLQADHRQTSQVTVRGLPAEHVPEFLADVRDYFGNCPAEIWVDDLEADAALGPALVKAGCSQRGATIYLAHVGPVPQIPVVSGLTIEPITPANLVEYAVTKLKSFTNSEAEPDLDEVREGVALRQAEMGGEGRFLLARFKTEPAGIIAWYEGEDRFVFLLATRVPFRGLGIAKSLICHVLADSYSRGRRSAIINADPEDTPVHLYRRLGFVDEVYWRRLYRLERDS